MKLTDIQCRRATPQEKVYKLTDADGLCLRIKPNGSKSWIFRYRFAGKEKSISFGMYPKLSLAEARDCRDKARKVLREGSNPSVTKAVAKANATASSLTTFEAVALEWHRVQYSDAGKDDKYSKIVLGRLERYFFKQLGKLPIDAVTTQQIVPILREIEEHGFHETASRCVNYITRIFRFARVSGLTQNNPSTDLQEILLNPKGGHFHAIETGELEEFLKKLSSTREYVIGPQVRLAMKLLMLTLVRTNELIGAKWDEVDFEERTWTVPAGRMKMKKEHAVPLSDQALEAFATLQKICTSGEWVFPNHQNMKKPMSNNAILFALYRMGYKGKMTGHGFRSLGMGVCKEKLGYRHEVVDRQLAHVPKDSVDRAYDRATFMDERRRMLQEYADYIDGLSA
jgi:integrase